MCGAAGLLWLKSDGGASLLGPPAAGTLGGSSDTDGELFAWGDPVRATPFYYQYQNTCMTQTFLNEFFTFPIF